MNSQVGARMVLENAKDALRKAGYTDAAIAKAVLSQGFLRLEQPLTTTSTAFNFPVLVNATNSGNAVRPTEKRLALQDAFFCSEIGVYIAKAASAADVSFSLTTYPNSVTFATGGAAPAPLNAFYNGQLQIAVNNEVIVPGMDIMRFKRVPQTQLTAATNSPIDEFDGANDLSNQFALEPNVVMIGQKNSQIVINLPGNISAVDANTYAVVIFRGVLAQNVTVLS
jgi:hypothetical protein